ncbi:hypothetical protein FO492_23795, partial [Bacillus paralicheniformis]|nr:hypothetical protein [Bacillus paralicheniformis]
MIAVKPSARSSLSTLEAVRPARSSGIVTGSTVGVAEVVVVDVVELVAVGLIGTGADVGVGVAQALANTKSAMVPMILIA